MKSFIKSYGILLMIVFLTLFGLASCTDPKGGTLEITNGHSAKASVGVSYKYEATVWNKDIEPGEKGTWTFDKYGKIEYVYSFYDNLDVLIGPFEFTTDDGEIKKVIIRP